jgi:Tol biopolymer transport system component
MNFDGSNRKQITVAPHALATSTGVAWSADGKWLAIVDGSDPRSHLWVVRANGTGLERLV